MVVLSGQHTNGTLAPVRENDLPELAPLDASKLQIKRAKDLKTVPEPSTLVFGAAKTDHMLIVEYDPASGWGIPLIKQYEPLQLDPASHCLHYSTNLFEGMKAYIGPDGTPLLFRPHLNMARMTRSAERLALPSFDPDALLALIKQLVLVERRWIPTEPGYSLYIRPTLIGTRPAMGVVASSHATLFTIVSPTGPFFKDNDPARPVKPVSLYASYDHVRAWPGGTGAFKLGGNYAPCFMPQVHAAKEGYQQILWLLGDSKKEISQEEIKADSKRPEMRITEAGQMNFFAVLVREDGDFDLVTPPLDGTILPGVTRDSCLALARHHNLGLSDPSYACLPNIPSSRRVYPIERIITVEELVRSNAENRVLEVFAAGTAAVVCPIGRIGYRGEDIVFPAYPSGFGPVSKAMLDALQSIFVGQVKSDWSVRCDE
ncbi:branched-chain amino acid aminotransferase II [Serendipita vermifera]|nr:branched-chain amino acid aminotransferase II [Serendipita vermifera]